MRVVYGNFVRASQMLSNLEMSVKNAVQQTCDGKLRERVRATHSHV